MCGIIDPGHTYDEYLVLLAKSGMTLEYQLPGVCGACGHVLQCQVVIAAAS
jgi:hypothetical protein